MRLERRERDPSDIEHSSGRQLKPFERVHIEKSQNVAGRGPVMSNLEAEVVCLPARCTTPIFIRVYSLFWLTHLCVSLIPRWNPPPRRRDAGFFESSTGTPRGVSWPPVCESIRSRTEREMVSVARQQDARVHRQEVFRRRTRCDR